MHLGDLLDPRAFWAWLVKTVRSAALRHARREARASGPTSSLPAAEEGGADPVDVVVSDHESQLLRAALERLPSVARGSVSRPPRSVRAIDLLAPIRRGSAQWWPPAWELGQFALLTEIVRSIEPGEFWQVGFATGSYDLGSARPWVKEFPLQVVFASRPPGARPPRAASTSPRR